MNRNARRPRIRTLLLPVALLASLSIPSPALGSHGGDHTASGWTFFKLPNPQPLCSGVAFGDIRYWDREDCGFGEVLVANTEAGDEVHVGLFGPTGAQIGDDLATTRQSDNGAWRFTLTPGDSPTWPFGEITARVVKVKSGSSPAETGNFGETTFFLNLLGGSVGATGGPFQAGQDIPVTGEVFEQDQVPPLAAVQKTGVGAEFLLQVTWPDGTVKGPYGPITASSTPGSEGDFSTTIPGAATTGITAGADTDFKAIVRVEIIDASYSDLTTGDWGADLAGGGSATVLVPPTTLIVDNSFLSSVGWVKPGEGYPFRVFVRNFTATAATMAEVTIPAPDGSTFVDVATSDGSAMIAGGTITWTIGAVAAAAADGTPAVKTLVVQAEADTSAEDPQIVWKDLSTNATLACATGPCGGVSDASHGPKVIPPFGGYETARYGDRPFPVVPVDFTDRQHEDAHTGDALANKVNSASIQGSTFNLYQEMSYQQLFPHGEVPSAEIASAGWEYPGQDFDFTNAEPAGACHGSTFEDVPGPSARGTPLYPERIVNGWYQLPGNTDYYGDDKAGPGSLTGVGPLFTIDDACGPTAKSVYDAAQIADPEIDYNEFDTDKDGVVDFFMMVFVGVGGNGVSQTSVPPYDNIWPHSSSLEFTYTDDTTGLKGYISDDQLKSLEGVPQCWTNDSYVLYEDCGAGGDPALPAYVRVGPYNVNPESAIDKASVISHEYGHSLGLPDFYSQGGRETYGDWNLMATDKSQNMDVFSKQELGWIVPRVLEPNQSLSVTGWEDSKKDIHGIEWEEPDGTPYELTGPGVHNGEAYVSKLPTRRIIDPQKVVDGATPTHVWWSTSGNDYGCTPDKGRNLDVFLPELGGISSGTDITLTFKSLWDIEWDYDYGFVMISTDGGETYESLPSANGYTTSQAQNPNASSCQAQYGNGITGSSGSYDAGTEAVDRVLGEYPDPVFLEDQYDLSGFAGEEEVVLRFSYSTDPGVARPAWFIDDISITAGSDTIYQTDFEGGPDDLRLFNGGCRGTERVAQICTPGWLYLDTAVGAPFDHAYYLEMRDRSGFDLDGHDENDRDPIGFEPGLLLTYTDEAHGYGNVGVDDPPAQTPLDSQPEPGNNTPNLNDAAYTAAAGDKQYSDAPPTGHTDNYQDPNSEDGNWHFLHDCLSFEVQSMAGTGLGPATPPYDLTGNVAFDTGAGCSAFDYGYGGGGGPDLAPTAVIQFRPDSPAVGQEVTFDGSASHDDLDPPGALDYAWDFDGDGQFDDATGQVAHHTFTTAGPHEVGLRVTDTAAQTDEAAVTVQVQAAPGAPGGTGGQAGGAQGGAKAGPGCPAHLPGTKLIVGTPGADLLKGSRGRDVICGFAGNDTLRGGRGKDLLVGGPGKDRLAGGAGKDRLRAGPGHDLMVGGSDRDFLYGGPGRDRLAGGGGHDLLIGGKGADRCVGGVDFRRSCKQT
ncbi:MAG: PKD domain-containing protein [Actinomycetota bacterium]